MMNNLNKVILIDCDGVLLNWEYAFTVWMERHGYEPVPENAMSYDVGERYGLTKNEKIQKNLL